VSNVLVPIRRIAFVKFIAFIARNETFGVVLQDVIDSRFDLRDFKLCAACEGRQCQGCDPGGKHVDWPFSIVHKALGLCGKYDYEPLKCTCQKRSFDSHKAGF
jgi:hypothetical protein